MKTLIFDLDGTLVQLKPILVCFADLEQLSKLRKQYNFALVTGSTKAEVGLALKQTKLKKLFDNAYIVTFEDTKSDKASGLPFLEIKKRITGPAVMIGDSVGDEVGSQKAGIPFVRVIATINESEQKRNLQTAIENAILVLENL